MERNCCNKAFSLIMLEGEGGVDDADDEAANDDGNADDAAVDGNADDAAISRVDCCTSAVIATSCDKSY